MNNIDQISYEQFRKLFVAEQYQYFQDNDYVIFVTYGESGLFNSFQYMTKEDFQKPLHDKFDNINLNNYISKKTYIENDFLSRITPHIENEDDFNFQKKFIYDFYKNHPECEDYILKLLTKLLDKNFKDIYQDFITQFSTNAEEASTLLNKFPKNILEYKMLSLPEVHNYFLERGFETKDFNDFLYTFLHNRKVQSNAYKYPIRDYLMEHFNQNEEQLKPYFDLLPVLKAEFIVPEVDIFLNDYKFSNVIHLGIDKMVNSFLIEKWQKQYYEDTLIELCTAIKNHYKIDSCFTHKKEFNNNSKNFYIIEFLHNQDNINTQDLKQLIIEYFTMLRANPQYISTPDAPDNWLFNRQLEKKISTKNINKNTNKKKI